MTRPKARILPVGQTDRPQRVPSPRQAARPVDGLRARRSVAYNRLFNRRKLPWKPSSSTSSPTRSPISPSARPSCGGIFDFDVKSERLAESSPASSKIRRSGTSRSARRSSARKRRRSTASSDVDHRNRRRAWRDAASSSSSRARRATTRRCCAVRERRRPARAQASRKLEFRRMFSNPMDPANCFIDIQAGSGGTEAQDWASMLLRMYLRYCERKGYTTEVLEESAGRSRRHQERVDQGRRATTPTGTCAPRVGVHRLVRKSPFDSNARRHTSFASVFVYPEVDDSIEVDINPADLRIDTYRASGAGGQHINKTDSAVRITHLPTNIVVQCQNDRSQHRNRAEAMAMLKSKLYELELRKRKEEQQKLEDTKTDIGWGHQIRSYVLDQSRIKDLRTNVRGRQHAGRARRRPRRLHRGEPEAGSLSMAEQIKSGSADPTWRRRDPKADGTNRQAGLEESRGCRRARAEAGRAARAGQRLSQRLPPRAPGADLHAEVRRARPTTRSSPEAIAVAVAGRMMLKRVMGKACFATLQDMSGRIQLYVTTTATGRRDARGVQALGPGRHRRRRRARSSRPRRASSRCRRRSCGCSPKSLRPLPEKFHGLTDQEQRYRQRYVDLITNPRVARRVRQALADRPGDPRVLRGARLPRSRDADDAADPGRRGGAAVRDAPQRARHGALPAHRAGALPQAPRRRRLEKVFEINRNFRNEGISHAAQSRVHDARVLRGLPGLPLPDGPHRGAAPRASRRRCSAPRRITYQGTPIDLAQAVRPPDDGGGDRASTTREYALRRAREVGVPARRRWRRSTSRCSPPTAWACCS